MIKRGKRILMDSDGLIIQIMTSLHDCYDVISSALPQSSGPQDVSPTWMRAA